MTQARQHQSILMDALVLAGAEEAKCLELSAGRCFKGKACTYCLLIEGAIMFITTTYPAQPHTRHCAKTGHFQSLKQCGIMSHFIDR